MSLDKYISYIIDNGLNLQGYQDVEIVGSSYINEFLQKLKDACSLKTSGEVYIKYTDGVILEDKINNGYNLYINDDIEYYNKLIDNSFCRIVIQSPFLIPLDISSDMGNLYKKEIIKLRFVEDYFNNLESQRTICLAANPYWASKLRISEEELWNKIIEYSTAINILDLVRHKFNKFKYLNFKNSIGTDLSIGLTRDCKFQGKGMLTKGGILFEPNIPCLEIYTAPNKYEVNGRLVSSKPIYYNGKVYERYYVEFKNGKIIQSLGLDDILSKDEGMQYCGEIAIVNSCDTTNYYSILLNENTACHLALGNAYPYGIEQIDIINKCPYHVDLIFGTDDLEIIGKCDNKKETIFKDGKMILEEEYEF